MKIDRMTVPTYLIINSRHKLYFETIMKDEKVSFIITMNVIKQVN